MHKSNALHFSEDAGYNTGITEINMVRATQIQQGAKPCYMTAERLFCKSTDCEWRRDCRKLVAVWKR